MKLRTETFPLSAWKPPAPKLPRRILKCLIHEFGIGIGSRVLLAGCSDVGLMLFLTDLGIDVSGLDTSETVLERARKFTDSLPLFQCQPGKPLPVNPGQFDLVLVHKLPLYQENLLSRPLCQTTTHLLASLRPGGAFAFLARHVPTANRKADHHNTVCLGKHAALFPGKFRWEFHSDSVLRNWRQILRGRPPGGYTIASLQLPAARLTLPEILRHHQSSIYQTNQPCCDWVAPLEKRAPEPRRAA